MITNKDKSKIKRYICKAPMFCHLELVERPYGDLVKYDNHVKLVAESAEQARKEAAERVRELAGKDCFRNPGYGEGYERGLYDAYLAILDDSVVKENLITDHIPDIGKKLAIAVKALEKIKKIGKAGSAFETHFSKLQHIGAATNDALREIQG